MNCYHHKNIVSFVTKKQNRERERERYFLLDVGRFLERLEQADETMRFVLQHFVLCTETKIGCDESMFAETTNFVFVCFFLFVLLRS